MGHGLWRGLGRAIVWLRWLIIPAWIAGALLVTSQLPSGLGSEAAELGSLLPRSSKAVEVEEKSFETFGFPLISRSMVVARKEGGFDAADTAAALRLVARTDRGESGLKAVPFAAEGKPLEGGAVGDTFLVYLYDAEQGNGARERRLRRQPAQGDRRRHRPRHRRPPRGGRRIEPGRRTHPLGRDRDRRPRRRDPRLLLPLAGDPAALPRRGRPRLPRLRSAARRGRRTVQSADPGRGAAGDHRAPLRVLTDYLVFFVSGFRSRLRRARRRSRRRARSPPSYCRWSRPRR